MTLRSADYELSPVVLAVVISTSSSSPESPSIAVRAEYGHRLLPPIVRPVPPDVRTCGYQFRPPNFGLYTAFLGVLVVRSMSAMTTSARVISPPVFGDCSYAASADGHRGGHLASSLLSSHSVATILC